MKESRKIEIYRQIQYRLGRSEQPTPRDIGLTETECRELGDGTQFRLEKVAEEGILLDNYAICELLYPAKALLAKNPDPLVPPVQSQAIVLPKSVCAVALQAVGKKLWDLFWAALLGLITGYIAYRIGFNRGQSIPAGQTQKAAINSKP